MDLLMTEYHTYLQDIKSSPSLTLGGILAFQGFGVKETDTDPDEVDGKEVGGGRTA